MNQIQILQKRVAQGVPDYKKDPNLDNTLISSYLNGDEDSLLLLVENYLDVICYIYRHPYHPPLRGKRPSRLGRLPKIDYADREDLLQEILYQFCRLVHEYDSGTGKPFEAIVKGKLHHRVHNEYFAEFLAIGRNEVELDAGIEAQLKSQGADAHLFIEGGKPSDHLDLYNALNKLSKRERVIVVETIMNERPSREVADELRITMSTIRTTRKRAISKLNQEMEENQ